MTQAQTQPPLYTFDEFINWYPENSEVRYELHDGVIIERWTDTKLQSKVEFVMLSEGTVAKHLSRFFASLRMT